MRHLLHGLVWTRRHLAGQLPAPELPALLPLLRPDDVFLDVGAHAGSWSIPASRVLTKGRVYAFEAFPYYARVLKLTAALMRCRNVTVVAGAVSDREGEVNIVWTDVAGHRLTGMTHIGRLGESGQTVRIRALTIDGFLDSHAHRRIRLVKCDVEGAELLVFRGATATIARWRPLVFCELYDEYCARFGYSSRDVFDFFAALGYRSMRFADGTFQPLEPGAYKGVGDVLFHPEELELKTRCG